MENNTSVLDIETPLNLQVDDWHQVKGCTCMIMPQDTLLGSSKAHLRFLNGKMGL